MTQPSYELDLRDLLDARYSLAGGPGWTQRMGIGTGTDIGPALSDGLAALRGQFGAGTIKIPPGSWLMNSGPAPLGRIGIEGAGSMASEIVYNNLAGAAFNYDGGGGFDGGGIRGLGLMLEEGLGMSNAYGILLQGNSTYQPDQMMFEDIYMSSIGASSYWWDGFHADGTARTHPQGIRIASLKQVEIFNCHNVPLYLSNVVGWTLENVGVFTGSGTNGNDIFIVGGSTHVTGVGVNYGGTLHTSPSLDVVINGVRYS